MHAHLQHRGWYSEDLPQLGVGQVMNVAQHQDLAVALVEAGESALQAGPFLAVDESLLGGRVILRGGVPDLARRLAPGEGAPVIAADIDRDLEQPGAKGAARVE